MAESAGVISAEIRLGLDNLNRDIRQAQTQIRSIVPSVNQSTTAVQNTFQKMGTGINTSMRNVTESAVGQFTSMAAGMKKAFLSLPIVGIITAIGATVSKIFTGIIKHINGTSKAFVAYQQEVAKIDTLLQTTGAIAWTSTRQMQEMAKELANISGHSTNEIMRMQGVLLGFRTITGEVFERTQKALVDMVAVMGGDLASAANTLGKAIDSPVQGMSALSRQGFIFTQQEKELVAQLQNSGQHLQAQEIILRAVEGAFAGTASAINNVNKAQAEFDANTERLRVAQGERTSGLAFWWTNLRAEMRGARADALEFNNAIARAESYDASVSIANIERLRNNLSLANDEVERLGAEHLLIKAELELDRTQASNALLLAQRDLRNYQAAMAAAGVIVNELNSAEVRRFNSIIDQHNETISLLDKEIAVRNEAAAQRQAQMALEEAQLELLAEQSQRLADAELMRVNALQEIERAEQIGLISSMQATSQRQSAYQAEANAINTIITSTNALVLTQSTAINQQNELLNGLNTAMGQAVNNHRALFDEIANGLVKPPITAAELQARMEQIQTAFARTQRVLADLRRIDAIDEESYNNQIIQARQAMANSVQRMLEESGLREEHNPRTYAFLRETIDMNNQEIESIRQVEEARRSLAEQDRAQSGLNDQIKELNHEYLKLTGSAREVQEAERQRAWDAVQASKEYQTLVNAEQDLMKARDAGIISQEEYNQRLEEARQKLIDIEEAFNRVWDAAQKNTPWQAMAKGVEQYGQQVAGIINSSMQLWADSVQRETRILQRELRKRYDAQIEAWEREKQARLYYAGLAKAVTSEQWEKELEFAKSTLNEKLILQAQEGLERALIEEEYAAKKLALDEETNRAEAELSYKAAMAQWQMQLTNAIGTGAMAVVRALAMPWPVGLAMGALAGTLTALQIGIVRANKPKLQSFSTGGIVAGNSFSGDNVLARVNSGERVVTQAQQARMTDILDGKESGKASSQPLYLTVNLDGLVIAKSTILDYVNKGHVTISGSRGVK